jgi:ketosteroid isomerase-like protein
LTDARIETVRRGFAAMSRGDYEEAIALMRPDVEYIPPGGQSPIRGAERLRRWMEPDAFDEQGIELISVDGSGEKLLVEQRLTARGAVSGIELELVSWSVWTFDEDGLVARLEIYLPTESAEAREAAGLPA